MTKRHYNKHNILQECNATMRKCRHRAFGHVDEHEYLSMVDALDPRVPFLKRELKRYPKEVLEARKEYKVKLDTVREIKERHMLYERKLSEAFTARNIPTLAEERSMVVEKNQLLNHVRNLVEVTYKNNGVSKTKIRELMRKPEATQNGVPYPVVEFLDDKDGNIFEKTTQTQNQLIGNRIYEDAKQRIVHISAEEIRFPSNKMVRTQIVRDLKTQYDIDDMQIPQAIAAAEGAKQKLAILLNKYRNGVPENVYEYNLKNVTADMLTVDSKGLINNAWVNNDGNYERITHYVPAKGNELGSVGKLVTDKGTECYHITRHSGYRVREGGTVTILLAPKNGDQFTPSKPFNVSTTIDSSD